MPPPDRGFCEHSYRNEKSSGVPVAGVAEFVWNVQKGGTVISELRGSCFVCSGRASGERASLASGSEQVPVPVYHPTPSQTRLATQLTEEEQIRIAQRIGLIQHLPKGVYDPGRDGSEKKIRECVICMMDFVYGDPIRFLPCMHIYHLDCIDDWLMRSFTCPSCMEPVDAALLSSYETN
ncbi:RING finger protein 11 isoform X1 [Ambystoma mexicanum]|uniref:RING finger protein 11 isoform X1 n=1 Tax=Ambystoma mexicanum TaxID=8296 RepID=UPI0037E9A9AC